MKTDMEKIRVCTCFSGYDSQCLTGWIEHFNLRDVTNTIHAQVGAARLNMEVLIAEFYND